MSKTLIIIFSKDRTLQLKSLLRSIRYHSDIQDDEIAVLYTTSPDIPYESLITEFGCNFVRESSFFADVKQIIDQSEATYVQFMVDDLIFRAEYRLRTVEAFLDKNRDVDCFSPRLGKNIQDGLAPQFGSRDDGFLVWDTADGLGRTWNYFWEISSSVYRRELVDQYLNRCDPRKVTYPNPFEYFYYGRMPSYLGPTNGIRGLVNRARFLGARRFNRMACQAKSTCFTQGVNLVAGRDIEYRTTFEPFELHQRMLEGFIIDYVSLHGVANRKPNAGSGDFRLTRDNPRESSA